ncbi:hypothetical protein F2Q69_00019270 [Brassica cretica]|uniref:Uncharacterized protein n=1 Tax=Brassica cretica TaxID=69181 RepID=A0A8S9Q7W3_BRACR|nr:hypothetical protein F2Q69_00019270 [Brassica cretica]
MTSRHTRSNAQGPLHQLTNEELARLERQNRQQPRPTNTTMAGQGNQDDLTAALAIIQQQMQAHQQQMLQMQQTIQNQQQAAKLAAENAAQEERAMFIMEEAAPNKNAGDLVFDAEIAGDDQQEKESEQPPADAPVAENEREPTVEANPPGTEQPAEAVCLSPEPVPAREYFPKVPYHVPARVTHDTFHA